MYQKEKVQGMYAYLNAELDRREALADPGDDLMGWLLEAEVDGDRLTRENILDIVYLRDRGTRHGGLLALVPDCMVRAASVEQARVVDDPSRLPGGSRN